MVKKFGDDSLIYNWTRNRNTIEFLGILEQIHNPDFKGGELETFRMEAGLNSFHLTPRKWVEATNAIGIQSRAGCYGGGTYAHKDLAFEFGSWLSPEFKLYLIKEFQRLKDDENQRLSLSWNLNRTLSKLNYRIHTDAVQETKETKGDRFIFQQIYFSAIKRRIWSITSAEKLIHFKQSPENKSVPLVPCLGPLVPLVPWSRCAYCYLAPRRMAAIGASIIIRGRAFSFRLYQFKSLRHSPSPSTEPFDQSGSVYFLVSLEAFCTIVNCLPQ